MSQNLIEVFVCLNVVHFNLGLFEGKFDQNELFEEVGESVFTSSLFALDVMDSATSPDIKDFFDVF